MSERALQAFETYVALGPDRTLAKVSELYAQRGECLPLVSLKRWSARYGWQSIIKQQQQTVAQAFCKKVGQAQVAQQLDDLSAVRELKRRFLWRVTLDPADPTLSKEERQLALAPSVRDYAFLIQLEKRLMADDTVTVEDDVPRWYAGLSADLSDEELQKAMRKHYGLPEPRDFPPQPDEGPVSTDSATARESES